MPAPSLTVNRASLLSVIANTNSGVVSNWSNINHIASTKQIITPKDANEVAEIVRSMNSAIGDGQGDAVPRRTQLRIVGSGMSYETIFSTDDINDDSQVVLDMCNFAGLVSLDENTATFGASTSIDEIIKVLGENQRMIPASPGVIGVQTLAGALATGTHGQGMRQSCYGDIVQSVQMVLPDGQLVSLTRGQTNKDLPPMEIAMAALGTCGVLLQVEIQTAPRRIFTCRKLICQYDVFLAQYETWNDRVEFVKAWWFPETDKCHVWLIDEASEQERTLFLSSEKNPNLDLLDIDMESDPTLNHTVQHYLDALYRDTGVTLDDQEEHQHSLTLQRFASSTHVIGYLEQIVTKGIPVPQINCEIAVPMSNFRKATQLLHQWALDHPHQLHYPFIYRGTGPSTTPLYPSYKLAEGIAYIGFLVYLAPDGSVREDGMSTMGELQRLLATETNGLPHMGKHWIPDAFDYSQNPGLGEIVKWSRKLDPKRQFLNKFLRNLWTHIETTSEAAQSSSSVANL